MTIKKLFAMILTTLMSLFVNSQNLVVNPGNEAPASNCSVPGWSCTVGTTWQQRTASPAPNTGGNYFFAGNSVVGGLSELRQVVDVSTYSASIDAGAQAFLFSGYIRSYGQFPTDQSRLILEFLDITQVVLGTFDSGYLSSTTSWSLITTTTLAPAGSRFARIRLISKLLNGTNNDGYFDDISLEPAIPLPIDLINFDVSCESGFNVLRWTVATANDCSGYLIERSSDALNWDLLKEITCVNSLGSVYEFADKAIFSGNTLYYRLSEKSKEGQQTVLGVRALNLCSLETSAIELSPNPAEEYFDIESKKGEPLKSIQVLNYSGQQLQVYQFLQVGNKKRIVIADLSPGVYVVIISTGYGIITKKFIK